PILRYLTGGNVRSVAISANGSYIVVGSSDDRVYLFHRTSSTPIGYYSTGDDVNSVAISADGSTFVAASGSTVSAFNLMNASAPELTFGSVVPESGDQNTQFNFSILYTDKENDPPKYLYILINGTSYPMEKKDPSDSNYTDGCMYQYFIYLRPGNYRYSFDCSDGILINQTKNFDLLVNHTNYYAPSLIFGSVTSPDWEQCYEFNFSVYYVDQDNNPPDHMNLLINGTLYTMEKQDPTDNYYTDGCLYQYLTFLPQGIYAYSFECNDSRYSNSTIEKILSIPKFILTQSSNLELEADDANNYTLTWNLIQLETFHYYAEYTFIDDVDWGNPGRWTVTEGSNTHIDVIPEKESRSKVVELWDNSTAGYSLMRNDFSPQSFGSVEFWVYGKAGTASMALIMLASSINYRGPYLRINWNDQSLWYYYYNKRGDVRLCNITPSSGFTEQTWHHIRIQFNCTIDKFDIWIDGEQEGSELPFANQISSMESFWIWTSSSGTQGGSSTYIDDIDYSWSPGYYLNRNMDYNPSITYYAIFENGIRETPWRNYLIRVYIDYNVSGMRLGAGVGAGINNISLVFNNYLNQWFYENITVIVNSHLNHPVLESISPNLNIDGNITLNWSEVDGATSYNIYRSRFPITCIDEMIPIATVSTKHYQDTVTTNGIYYYVIVAGNSTGNSSLSNCKSVEVRLTSPTISTNNFTIWLILVVGSVGGVTVSSIVGIRKRQTHKRKEEIASLLSRVLNEPIMPFFAASIPPSESEAIYNTQIELFEEDEAPNGMQVEIADQEQPMESHELSVGTIFLILASLIKAFPSLNQQFTEAEELNLLMKLQRLPSEEIFAYFNDLISKVPENEIKSLLHNLIDLLQLYLFIREVKTGEENAEWTQALQKLAEIVELAESLGNRELLNELMQLLILIKCSF
ncbi:MAG: hypothetical protein HWN66_20110, partial [Candidatus Helarchaeota archaeon]|nr:hypothetical protein [Candidatus Helarchaeota archaeon]